MKLLSFLFLFTALNVSVFSQEITFFEQNNHFLSSEEQTVFCYISKDLDAIIGTTIATANLQIQKSGKKNYLSVTFYTLWKEANMMGANAFYINKIDFSEETKIYDIDVELWFLDNREIMDNLKLYPKNLIVVFGDINTKMENIGKAFKVNKEGYTAMPYTFSTYPHKAGEKTKINVGGFSGMTSTFIGQEGILPVFLCVGGGTVAPFAGYSVAPSGGSVIGVSFTTGSIVQVDTNFGMFLMEVLK
jgi:hypothetical protein